MMETRLAAAFLLIAALSGMLCAEGTDPQDVSIPSPGATSGPITLHGSLFLPASTPAPVPGIVFIHGSGPGDRYETLPLGGEYYERVFYSLARNLSDIGYAVLVWDKRSCPPPKCNPTPTFCQLSPPPCVNTTLLSVFDFIADAEAAAKWLQERPDVDHVNVLGWSQGCDFAPIVAQNVGARNVITMMGAGRGINNTLLTQLALKLQVEQTVLAELEAEHAKPSVIDAQKAAIANIEVLLNSSRSALNAITSGEKKGYDRVVVAGAPSVAKFWIDWIDLSVPAARAPVVRNSTGGWLAINGPGDDNVPPSIYDELHSLMLASTRVGVYPHNTVFSPRIVSIPDISHLLISLSSLHWRIMETSLGKEVQPHHTVVNAIVGFLCDVSPVAQCLPNPGPSGSHSDSHATKYALSVVGGVVLGALLALLGAYVMGRSKQASASGHDDVYVNM